MVAGRLDRTGRRGRDGALRGGGLGRDGVVVGAATREAHQTTLVVLGVLAVPPVVTGLDDRDLGEVVLGRR
jgi:hypothetical protein